MLKYSAKLIVRRVFCNVNWTTSLAPSHASKRHGDCYRYRKLPFGLVPSPELFQAKLDQCLEGLIGIHTIADDILITGKGDTMEEACRDHDKNMRNFLERCHANNIKLNRYKIWVQSQRTPIHRTSSDQFRTKARSKQSSSCARNGSTHWCCRSTEICWHGELLSQIPAWSLWYQWTIEKTDSQRCWVAVDKWTRSSILLYQAISNNCPNTQILWLNHWHWRIRRCLPEWPWIALLQNDQPVTYASRALTPAETRCSQIETELLAQVFGFQRNHHYVYVRKVRLWTEHKPIISIARKPLSACPKQDTTGTTATITTIWRRTML